MIWTEIYFIVFLIGFALSFLSFLLGSFDFHFPSLHMDGGVHFHMDGVHAGHAGHAGHGSGDGSGGQLSLFNFGTISAFLAWFGGTGYLLTKYSSLWVGFVMLISISIGLVGAAAIFLFVAKVLMRSEMPLNPADYQMVGVLGAVTVPIREGGTGEIVFSQEGVRRCTGARSEDAAAIPKGAEVIVTRYEKGIAYVKRWEDLAGEASAGAPGGGGDQTAHSNLV
jgi:membrane protein implicated in regulation of membrane protease activity